MTKESRAIACFDGDGEREVFGMTKALREWGGGEADLGMVCMSRQSTKETLIRSAPYFSRLEV